MTASSTRPRVAVAQGGATLAPVVGALVEAEPTGGSASELEPFRPGSFRRTTVPAIDPTQEDS